ncbi:MAG: hypothetical protein HOQ24_03775 [Mycobacteriaceae bacterium]|nr:hypothetical protein [Mycobacteriaceae bacterium]
MRMRLCVAIGIAVASLIIPGHAAAVAETVEATFSKPGPWAVSAQRAQGCCSGTGKAFDVWFPTDLGRGGTRHPIIAWGDGTNAVPSQYSYLLAHLASWGFVVVASESTATGSGQDIRDSARYLLRQNDTPDSVFYRKLNPRAVGVYGHSQGATGAINALAAAPDLVATAVAAELPSQLFCVAFCTDTRRLRAGSVYFVNGSADLPISPSTQLLPWQAVGLQSNRAYYEATPGMVSKTWATVNGVNHNDIQGKPDCARASFPCAIGVFGFLGYPTAWFADRLQHDDRAHRAFVTGVGELMHAARWSNQISSITS